MLLVRPQVRNSRAKFSQANNLLAFLPHTGGFKDTKTFADDLGRCPAKLPDERGESPARKSVKPGLNYRTHAFIVLQEGFCMTDKVRPETPFVTAGFIGLFGTLLFALTMKE